MTSRMLLVLFCVISLALSESDKKAKSPKPVETADTKDATEQCTACADVPDYGPQISALDTKLQTITDGLDLSAIKGYGASIGDVKKELTDLSAKLKTFQNEQAADKTAS